MVLLYGLGRHATMQLRNRMYLCNEIEAIIDGNPAVGILWENYMTNREKYKAVQIVIGVPKSNAQAYGEIRGNIVNSGLFKKENILELMDWIWEEEKKYSNLSVYETIQKACRLQVTKEYALPTEFKPEWVKNAKVIETRHAVMDLLPKNGVAAEIGVAIGRTSRIIVDKMQPQKFYAIDFYSGFPPQEDVYRKLGMNQREYVEHIFEKEIQEGTVELRQGISWECLAEFEDDYFDYVYLDAGHDYESVKRDLKELQRVVKDGGIIQFNDFVRFVPSDYVFGIVRAVYELLNETKSELMYHCLASNGFDDVVVKLRK